MLRNVVKPYFGTRWLKNEGLWPLKYWQYLCGINILFLFSLFRVWAIYDVSWDCSRARIRKWYTVCLLIRETTTQKYLVWVHEKYMHRNVFMCWIDSAIQNCHRAIGCRVMDAYVFPLLLLIDIIIYVNWKRFIHFTHWIWFDSKFE